MKKWLILLLAVGLMVGGYYSLRLYPLLTNDNSGAQKVVLLHGLGRTRMSTLLLESALTEEGLDVHAIEYPSTDKSPAALVEFVSAEINSSPALSSGCDRRNERQPGVEQVAAAPKRRHGQR